MEATFANPAKPEDREKQDLPPKSYAAAAVEEAPPKREYSENGEKKYTNRKINGKSKSPNKKSSVLRIVNTNGKDKSSDSEKSETSDKLEKDVKLEKDEKDERVGRPTMERQESKHEYTAEVIQPIRCFRELD